MLMQRNVVILDTNVVIEDCNVLSTFKDNEIVIISKILLDEVDNNKKGYSSKAISCRNFARNLYNLLKDAETHRVKFLTENHEVQVVKNGKSFIVLTGSDFDFKFTDEKNDDRIVVLAKEVKKFFETVNYDNKIPSTFMEKLISFSRMKQDFDLLKIVEHKDSHEYVTTLITNDNIMSISATMQGVPVKRYSLIDRDLSDIYETSPKINVSEQTIADFYSKKLTDEILVSEYKVNTFENQYIQLIQGEHSIIGKMKNGVLTPIKYRGEKIYGINAKNEEQKMFLDALLDDDIKVVSCLSKAGTGKSLLAIASALHMIEDTKQFNQLLLYKPYVAVRGQEIGFLKGSEEDKVYPAFASLFDSLEFLYNVTGKSKGRRSYDAGSGRSIPLNGLTIYEDLKANGVMELDVMTFIRGRSFSNKKIIIIDESQNLSVHEVKTLATRLGEDCKLIVLSDVSQIDNNYLTPENCGPSVLTDALKGQKFFTTVNLSISERSMVCEIISDLL